jgi:hypothetical protein
VEAAAVHRNQIEKEPRMSRKLGIAAVVAAVASLSLTGVASAAAPPTNPTTLTPNAVDFGSQTVGTTSGARTVELAVPCTFVLDLGQYGGRTCTSPGNIGTIRTTGDFAQTNNCVLPISNASVDGTVVRCTISVTFTPTAAGARTGELKLTSYGIDTYSVPLSGNGEAPTQAGQPGGSGAGTKGSSAGGVSGAAAKCKKKAKRATTAKKCKRKVRR